MKCLSLIQPYAKLIISGKKRIELRKWNTKFRGEFLVHASKKIDKKACERFGINPNNITTGAILGKANIYGIKIYRSKSEFLADSNKHLAEYEEFSTSKYGFLIKDAVKFEKPIPMKGKLNFFEADKEITASLQS